MCTAFCWERKLVPPEARQGGRARSTTGTGHQLPQPSTFLCPRERCPPSEPCKARHALPLVAEVENIN